MSTLSTLSAVFNVDLNVLIVFVDLKLNIGFWPKKGFDLRIVNLNRSPGLLPVLSNYTAALILKMFSDRMKRNDMEKTHASISLSFLNIFVSEGEKRGENWLFLASKDINMIDNYRYIYTSIIFWLSQNHTLSWKNVLA